MNESIFQMFSETYLSPLPYIAHKARLLTAKSNMWKNCNSDVGLGSIEKAFQTRVHPTLGRASCFSTLQMKQSHIAIETKEAKMRWFIHILVCNSEFPPWDVLHELVHMIAVSECGKMTLYIIYPHLRCSIFDSCCVLGCSLPSSFFVD